MKKLLFITVCLFSILSSCTKSDIHLKGGDENVNDCLVMINPVGEITTSENPMTKLGNNDGLYLIQVTQNDTIYAAGVYKNLSNVKVYLHKNLAYTIKVSAIGTRSYIDDDSHCSYSVFYKKANLYKNTATQGFPLNTSYDTFVSELKFSSSEVFNELCDLNDNTTDPKIGQMYYSYRPYYMTKETKKISNTSYSHYAYYFKSLNFRYIDYAIIENEKNPTNTTDWFYGESTITPTGSYLYLSTIFKRVGYKLKYELDGVSDGDVTVTIKTQEGKILVQNTTNTETYSGDTIFVPYYDIRSVYQNPDNYYENLIVSVSWLRGIGVTQDLGSTTIQVKRNNLNRVRIHLGNSDAGAAMNLSTEAESMGSDSTSVTVEQ